MNPHSAPAPRRPAPDASVHDREETFLRRFVGRETELARFRAALDESPGTVTVLALHGPGGIGKTQLLRRFAVEARRRGRHVVAADAGRTGPTEEAFAAAADVPGTGRPVLLVDNADRLGPLEDWFRDRYLTGLPPGSLVVLAGREPPGLRWRTDPAWADTLRVGRLDRLSRAESGRLLQDAAPGRTTARGARLAFAAGHPLALRLAARDRDAPPGQTWQPAPETVAELMDRVVGPVPSPLHRQALEICAHVPETTEDLLRAFLPDQAHEIFDWLRRRPYAISGRAGLRLLPVVAEALDRDLGWRAPDAYLSLHKALRTHLQTLIRTRPEPVSLSAAGAFHHIQTRGRRLSGPGRDVHAEAGCDPVYETPCDAEDLPAVRDLAHERLGPEGVAAVDFWLHRRPHGFHLYRAARTGEIVGVLGLLTFDRWDAVETAIDPVVAVVREHVESHREPGPGERVNLVRFALLRRRPHDLAAASAAMLVRVTRELHVQDRLAWTFHAQNGDGPDGLLEYADFRRLPGGPRLAAQNVTLFGHDWGTTGMNAWCDLLDDRMLFGLRTPGGTGPPRTAALSRAAFDRAVHDLLRDWHQRERLAQNPLLHAAFVARHSGDPEQNLRRLVVRAIESIDQDPRAKGQRAAVWATYVEGGSTQQAVARELALSFSTYRRYLKRGLERVCWHLWEQEAANAARGTSAW
ncbi:AAA family ATPase [Streptomyces sp. LP11]|uniref:AAA family ATPase n=1 Tax=Streptomyces pyxinicus TaxID=2970331 RepID=A0ABT2AX83_9ACTN|nr:ATP-binding protein [Streptomyces sp. LP11]MCS0600865.1 AAA family ATPase [Streptomyces sp. LP11]